MKSLGSVIKQQRKLMSLTVRKLAALSGVSASHLGRIERGERFPSARVLRRIARPLGFEEDELFVFAGYLSPTSSSIAEAEPDYTTPQLDPHVATVLAQEPLEVQRLVIGILTIMKSLAKSTERNSNSTP